MMSQIRAFLLLITLFVMVSCSQKSSSVKLEIGHSFVFGNTVAMQAIAGGGLMVWGSSSNGDAFAQALEGTNDLNQQLSNGTWTFYAMAWDGSKNFNGSVMSPGMYFPFGGVQRCAKSATVDLNGSDTIVNLALNNANCSDTTFTGSLVTGTDGANITLPQTSFSFCRSIAQLTNGQEICADTLKDDRQKERKAYISSFKVKMKNYKTSQGAKSISGEISSKCIPMAGDLEIPSVAPVLSDSSFYGASSMKINGLPLVDRACRFILK